MSYTFMPKAGQAGDPVATAHRQAIARQLLQQSMTPRPIGSHLEGAAQVAKALTSGLELNAADKQAAEQRQQGAQAFSRAMGDILAGNGSASAVDALSSPYMSDVQQATIAKLLASQQKGSKPMLVGAGASVFDPSSGKVLHSQPFKPDTLSPDAFNQKLALRKAGRTTISNVNNTGGSPMPGLSKLPKGFTYIYENGMPKLDERGVPIAVPIQGTPQAIKEQEKEQKRSEREQTQKSKADLVADDIDRALAKIDEGVLPTTGFGGTVAGGIGGTSSNDLRALTDTIKANIGFAELNQMRAQSPTGGALGNVTERELKFLQSVAGSLDQSQTEQQFRDNLNRLWNSYQDVIHGQGEGPARRPLSYEREGNSQLDDLLKKYGQ